MAADRTRRLEGERAAEAAAAAAVAARLAAELEGAHQAPVPEVEMEVDEVDDDVFQEADPSKMWP